MTQKKSYSRYFIILQEDEKGYALASDKLPSGYAKLEIKNDKCKVSYYVQNLKKESAPYYMVLICNKKDAKKLLRIGELNIDEHGRADVFYEYPVENVGNCGVGVDKIVGASIVRLMNSNIISVMSGFASTDIPDWKGFPMVESDKQRQEEASEERMDKNLQPVKVEPIHEGPVIEQVPEVEQTPVVEQAPMVEQQQPSNIFDEYEMKIEEEKAKLPMEETKKEQKSDNIPMDIMEMDDMEFDYEDDRHKKKSDCENKKHEDDCNHKKEEKNDKDCGENKCKDHHDNDKNENNKANNKCNDDYPKGTIGKFFKDIAEGFEELDGMCSEIKRCKWYKVPVYKAEDMTSCMDYNKHTVVYHPMINYYQYIIRFGHFIMGHKFDKENKMKYIVYGIPGTKSRADQPFGGRSGFVTWVPLREGDEGENSYGYWLMFYDFKNSTIVVPVK